MKKINQYIIEKLKISKNSNNVEITSIDFNQLTDLLLYCQCFLKEEELVEEYDEWISWGEMERYSQFGINWYDDKHKWISEYGLNHEDGISKKMDNIGVTFIRLVRFLQKKKWDFIQINILVRDIVFYLIEYLPSYGGTKVMDMTKIKNINTNVYGRPIKIDYGIGNINWQDISKKIDSEHKDIYNQIQDIYKYCLYIME